MHLLGFCPNGDKDASDHSGDGTAYAKFRDHVVAAITNYLGPNISFTNTNCRENCRKQKCGRFCALLTTDEVDAASTRIKSQIALGDIIISLGGYQSDRVVKQVALFLGLSDEQYFVGGKHASTHVVRYSRTWCEVDAQFVACIGSATSLSKFLFEAGLSAHPRSLFNALANDVTVGYVRDGEDVQAIVQAHVQALDQAHVQAVVQALVRATERQSVVQAKKDQAHVQAVVQALVRATERQSVVQAKKDQAHVQAVVQALVHATEQPERTERKKQCGNTTFQNKRGIFATRDGVENAGCVEGGNTTFQNKTGVFATKDGVENAGCVEGGKKGGKQGGKSNVQNKTGIFATKDGVENAGCVGGGKKGGKKQGKKHFQNKTGIFATVHKNGGNKPGHGIGKHSTPKTTKEQTQVNFEEFQRNFPEKLPEGARGKGFHYLELKRFKKKFINATSKRPARVQAWKY
eukprot:SAG31_NODE_4277_length_3385_cov_3.624163_2_plen_462_part_00